jgi:hypothetical protein
VTTDFIKDLVGEVDSDRAKEKRPTRAFTAGYAAGLLLVAVGTFAIEGLLLAAVATLLGWPLSFLQGLGLAALFELVVLRLKQ